MRLGWAVPILALSGVVVLIASFTSVRSRGRVGDLLLAVGGAGLGLGALFFQDDVSTVGWVLSPALMAVLCVVHVRVLVAAGGPLRR